MCGRFTLTSPEKAIREVLEREEEDSREELSAEALAGLEEFEAAVSTRDLRPTQFLPVVRRVPAVSSARWEVVFQRWGLVPSWAPDPRDARFGAQLINARAETLRSKPSFREAFAQRRCLVPADGFYEWANREQWWIRQASGEPFAFAGLWESWRDPRAPLDVVSLEPPLETFTIVTRAADPEIRHLHDRMPVMLFRREDRRRWLEEEDPEALEEVLRVPTGALSMEEIEKPGPRQHSLF
jgi:putative SOS response-associated peptidase YedK